MKTFDLNVIWDAETKEQLPATLLAFQDGMHYSMFYYQIYCGSWIQGCGPEPCSRRQVAQDQVSH